MSSARRSGMGCAFFATPAGCYAEKQWGSIRETHFQAEEILIVKAQRSAFSEPLAVIRITAARSPFGMTTPPRKATTLPELAGTRSPGTTMPTRFIGSRRRDRYRLAGWLLVAHGAQRLDRHG